jgi:hypothetical protein
LITGWLYNGAGSSVLIAGFHSMHNAIVNTTGLVAVVALPQFDVLLIKAGSVVLAAAIIAVATSLGLKRSLARRPEYVTAWRTHLANRGANSHHRARRAATFSGALSQLCGATQL